MENYGGYNRGGYNGPTYGGNNYGRGGYGGYGRGTNYQSQYRGGYNSGYSGYGRGTNYNKGYGGYNSGYQKQYQQQYQEPPQYQENEDGDDDEEMRFYNQYAKNASEIPKTLSVPTIQNVVSVPVVQNNVKEMDAREYMERTSNKIKINVSVIANNEGRINIIISPKIMFKTEEWQILSQRITEYKLASINIKYNWLQDESLILKDAVIKDINELLESKTDNKPTKIERNYYAFYIFYDPMAKSKEEMPTLEKSIQAKNIMIRASNANWYDYIKLNNVNHVADGFSKLKYIDIINQFENGELGDGAMASVGDINIDMELPFNIVNHNNKNVYIMAKDLTPNANYGNLEITFYVVAR